MYISLTSCFSLVLLLFFSRTLQANKPPHNRNARRLKYSCFSKGCPTLLSVKAERQYRLVPWGVTAWHSLMELTVFQWGDSMDTHAWVVSLFHNETPWTINHYPYYISRLSCMLLRLCKKTFLEKAAVCRLTIYSSQIKRVLLNHLCSIVHNSLVVTTAQENLQ